MENQRSGLVRCAANSMTFATVKRLPLAGSFAIFRSPAMPGMLRKSTAFVPRYQKFESISLQRRVGKLSVPERRTHRCENSGAYATAITQPWPHPAIGSAPGLGDPERRAPASGSSDTLVKVVMRNLGARKSLRWRVIGLARKNTVP